MPKPILELMIKTLDNHTGVPYNHIKLSKQTGVKMMNWPNPDQTFNCDENYHQWNICRNEAKGTLCKRTCLICGKSGGYKHDVEHVPTFYGYANHMWRKEAGPNGKTYRSCKRCENKVYGTPGKSLSITHDKV